MSNKEGGSAEHMQEISTHKRGPSIGRLDSVGRIAIEVGRIYRHARRGQIDTIAAYRLASVLAVMAKCLEQSQIEARLDDLERVLIARDRPQPQRTM
jgi:hypothetical protein